MIAFLFLVMAVGCRSIAELQQHGKLRWMQHGNYIRSFWDEDSYLRKYKLTDRGTVIPAPTTYYYKLFNLKYKERFPGSATIFSFLTDGMHLMQWAYHILLALSLSQFSGYSFWIFWPTLPFLHALWYRIFSK